MTWYVVGAVLLSIFPSKEDADELCIILHFIRLASAGLFERTNEGYMTTELINPRHVDVYC